MSIKVPITVVLARLTAPIGFCPNDKIHVSPEIRNQQPSWPQRSILFENNLRCANIIICLFHRCNSVTDHLYCTSLTFNGKGIPTNKHLWVLLSSKWRDSHPLRFFNRILGESSVFLISLSFNGSISLES